MNGLVAHQRSTPRGIATPTRRLATEAIRRVLPAAALMLLAACGGGGDEGPVGPTSGRLYPAAAGVVFTEIDSTGHAIQQSSPTGSDGRFKFPRPLRGGVIETRSSEFPTWRSAAFASARVELAAAEVIVSPMSTAAERMSGQSDTASAARASEGLGPWCMRRHGRGYG